MSNTSDRSRYWEEGYFEYWRARVDEANKIASKDSSRVNINDTRTPDDDATNQFLAMLEPNESDDVLEVGCGFGRTVLTLAPAVRHVTAIDISSKMIQEASKASQHLTNVRLMQSEAESISIEDSSFDKIFCYGVFEALHQAEALCEFNRLLKISGCCLITGKNSDYSPFDAPALFAEEMARKNGHPNFFTDVRLLSENLEEFGFRCVQGRYFETRESMSENVFLERPSEKFYYYGLLLEKVAEVTAKADELEIASPYSSTWLSKNSGKSSKTKE